MTDDGAVLPERTFGWSDMWARPEDDPREGGGPYSGERQTLVRHLRDQRLTVELKCAGLDAEGMARRSAPPSDMSLLGLVRHLAEVEQYWFRRVMAGEDVTPHYTSATVAFGEATADPEVVEDAWATWRAEVSFAERFVAEALDLDVLGDNDKTPIPLRDVLVHMIEEYARHNGHADLLRERIDGRVGQ
ncbi:DinB family protein [Saccharothrix luteola]|uniref:DinB family protein n=1 Tax=Saccharothrix luteola TaxID=2893018 RepID=UPI001E5C809D|nr:DinB family protein [Saccharothrix luteola]MCC8246172.1 DinB family protein [Saccharothrix luteola]